MHGRLGLLVVMGIAVTLSASCGEPAPTAGAGGDPTVVIESPNDGARVVAPFEVELESAVELGSPDSGKHHVRIVYDGKARDYTVVEDTTFTVSDLPPGEHTIEASLRNADESPAGATDSIAVTVATGDDGAEEDTGGDDGGYGY